MTNQSVSRAYCPSMGVILSMVSLLSLFWASGVQASGGSGGEEANWMNFLWRMINFIILVGFLYWLLAKKLVMFFGNRRAEIRQSMEDAEKRRKEAQDQFQLYEEKLKKAHEEIDGISRMIQVQGEEERRRIIENAHRTAEKLKEDTQVRMQQEIKKAVKQLQIETARLSVSVAGDRLKKEIRMDDHNRMVQDYIEKVVIPR